MKFDQLRGIERQSKNFKNRFRLIKRNWIGIKRDGEFWPKNYSFWFVKRQLRLIEKVETQNFWKLEIFYKNTIKNQFSWYEMHMNDSKSFQKHVFFKQLNFPHQKFNFFSSKSSTQILKRVLNITQCIISNGQIS